jgi:hypothetical protein
MKFIATTILLSLIFFSCTKEVVEQVTPQISQKQKTLVLEHDDFGANAANRTIGKGRVKNNRPPKDTTVVTDPGTSEGGANLFKLDIDGEYISGTAWNTGGDFYAKPPSMPVFELYNVLNAVIEAYASYKVSVTFDEQVYFITPIANRQREVITDSYEWYGMAGGVAYRNSFGTETPCFVFSGLLSNNTQNVTLAAVHELGHTVGLPHKADGYYDSTGAWVILASYTRDQNWMGAGYSFAYHVFETDAPDYYGNKINQPLVINNTLK